MQKLVRFYIRFFLHSSVFVRLVAFGLSGRSFSLIHLFFGQLVSMCRQREIVIIIIIALLRMYQRASEHSSSAIPRNRLQAPRKHDKSGLVCWRYLSSFVFRSPGRQNVVEHSVVCGCIVAIWVDIDTIKSHVGIANRFYTTRDCNVGSWGS
jgi:hypothetical protein